MDSRLEQSKQLKQALLDFVLDAEGDLATALEAYSAEQLAQWSKSPTPNLSQTDLVVDMFLTEGQVQEKTPLQLFVEQHPDLSESDRALIESWHQSFNGLFAVMEVLPDGYELLNWLTEKRYRVCPNGSEVQEKLARLNVGEIILTRIAPVDAARWTFSGPMSLLGKLGKPKLAVAIGNFKDQFNHHLYQDAPELLEEAWASVERYHQEFMDFFESDDLTLSGYELNKKMVEFQAIATQRRLEAAGLDSSKSLGELAEEAGVSQEDLAESLAEMGEDKTVVEQLLTRQSAAKMVMPEIKLPDPLRKAEAVTVLVHPRWGQTFLTDYQHLTQLLDTVASHNEQQQESLSKLLQRYLKETTITTYVWYRLAHHYPDQLEMALRKTLDRPTFDLTTDLDDLLKSYGKPLKPGLPEIASVPLHLHNLFQEALAEVNDGKSKKSKSKGKSKAGFGGK